MKKFLFFIFLSIVSNLSVCAMTAYSPQTNLLDPGAYEIFTEVKYFGTTSKLDIDGIDTQLDEGQAFQLLDFDLVGRYAFGTQLELIAGGRYRQVLDETEAESNTVSGLESYLLGLKYSFISSSKLKFAVDIHLRDTLYTNEEYVSGASIASEELILGDSGQEITIGLYADYLRNKTNTIAAYGAYRVPGNSLSPEFIYDLHSAWHGSKWALLLGVKGIMSLGQDDYATDQTGRPVQAVPKSSNMFYSINRSFMSPYAGLNLRSGQWLYGIQASQVISGTSTDVGAEMLFNVTWSSQGETKEARKLKTFKEYDIEASVIKISPRGKFIKIDKGLAQDIEKGMRMDIFQTDFFGKNELIASGYVYELGADWSIVKLTKKYRQISVKVGFSARGK